MSDSGTSDIETLEIKKRNRSRHSNGHNFSHGGPIQAHHIWRRSKLNKGSAREIQMVINYHTEVRFRNITYQDAQNWTTEALEKFKWSKIFSRMSDSSASYIETLEIEKTKCLEKFKFLQVLTRRSDSSTSHMETPEIEQRKLSRNWNGHNFSLECPIQAHNISRRSKLNNGSSQEIYMIINFHSDLRFRCNIYRDARKGTTKSLEKFKWS